jgi:uncharacterized protein YjbI with pentapeptide repeats
MLPAPPVRPTARTSRAAQLEAAQLEAAQLEAAQLEAARLRAARLRAALDRLEALTRAACSAAPAATGPR